GETTFSIVESGHGGSWADQVYTSHTAGDWTVRGSYSGLTDDADLMVVHAAAVSIEVTPDPETVTAGDSVTYQATAEDAYGNTWDATGETVFSIESGAGGSWADSVYTSEAVGTWIVTGVYEGLRDTATLNVLAQAPSGRTVFLPLLSDFYVPAPAPPVGTLFLPLLLDSGGPEDWWPGIGFSAHHWYYGGLEDSFR
ncbi:MAG: hypothetical protein SXV54_00190, partial [Chloroflexota bacterium]|nr:hypothetical protein [Chloroflexota bacterium]